MFDFSWGDAGFTIYGGGSTGGYGGGYGAGGGVYSGPYGGGYGGYPPVYQSQTTITPGMLLLIAGVAFLLLRK